MVLHGLKVDANDGKHMGSNVDVGVPPRRVDHPARVFHIMYVVACIVYLSSLVSFVLILVFWISRLLVG